jgi:hypothetical protein
MAAPPLYVRAPGLAEGDTVLCEEPIRERRCHSTRSFSATTGSSNIYENVVERNGSTAPYGANHSIMSAAGAEPPHASRASLRPSPSDASASSAARMPCRRPGHHHARLTSSRADRAFMW